MESSVFAPVSVPRPPSAPASVDRLLRVVPAAARGFVLEVFLKAAREEGTDTSYMLRLTREQFADMRTCEKGKGGLSSYVTHQVGFLMLQQFTEAPHAVRDLANYARHTVAYEAALETETSEPGDEEGASVG